MGLTDEIHASHDVLYKNGLGGRCTMRLILDYLDEEDRVALQKLLDDPRVFGTSICALLKSWAPKVAQVATATKNPERRAALEYLSQLCGQVADPGVQRHRRGKCQCPRAT